MGGRADDNSDWNERSIQSGSRCGGGGGGPGRATPPPPPPPPPPPRQGEPPRETRRVKYIGRTSQNSSPNAPSGPSLWAGYRPVTAAATAIPSRGSLSRASTQVT
ncbi:hypothetical protein GCM10018785_27800 [Streptomyces longispororuber]|uniref:Uncharacterized protein n=1 Tax=Streptomyces longispororuber TaxID=68230 RepID=A0A919DMJ8_9ACTN|nr:hypothetical protein GCM10018785_27800 [Streptomyces longispororuber]